MTAQANVYTTVSNQVWYTDRCRIATGATTVTCQVYLYPDFANTIYSAPIQVPSNSVVNVIVGVGNKMTITGTNFTASEGGSASSGTAGVNQPTPAPPSNVAVSSGVSISSGGISGGGISVSSSIGL